jgi:hypothetical protein
MAEDLKLKLHGAVCDACFLFQCALSNLHFFFFIDRQIPQKFEFIEAGRFESSQYHVSMALLFRSVFPKLHSTIRHRTVVFFILLTPCILLSTEYHKPTTSTLYYALKCSNYTPTCFEPSLGSAGALQTAVTKSCDHTVRCVCDL